MQALEFVLSMRPAVPFSIEKGCAEATNSEIRRWFKNKAIRVNGEMVGWDDTITFPVTDLVFFPKSPKRKTTLV
jgi:acetone carboxylase gamma subunit